MQQQVALARAQASLAGLQNPTQGKIITDNGGSTVLGPALLQQAQGDAGTAGQLAAGLSGHVNTAPPSQGDVAIGEGAGIGLTPQTTQSVTGTAQTKQTAASQLAQSRANSLTKSQQAQAGKTSNIVNAHADAYQAAINLYKTGKYGASDVYNYLTTPTNKGGMGLSPSDALAISGSAYALHSKTAG